MIIHTNTNMRTLLNSIPGEPVGERTPNRTYGKGRKCANLCGTVLSVYNSQAKCGPCSRKDH